MNFLKKRKGNLKNNEMRKIGIIVAMDKEMALLLKTMHQYKEIVIMNQSFYRGAFEEKEVIFTTAGIGKVNAGVTTALMIEHFQPELIINSGIAGGFLKTLKPLDMVAATKIVYSDVDMTSDIIGNLPYGQMEGSPAYFQPAFHLLKSDIHHFGTIISGDQFVDDIEKVNHLVKKYFPKYDVVAVDMESASIAQVCTKYNVPFLVIRSISDSIGKSNGMDYDKFSYLASDKSCEIVLETIKSL